MQNIIVVSSTAANRGLGMQVEHASEYLTRDVTHAISQEHIQDAVSLHISQGKHFIIPLASDNNSPTPGSLVFHLICNRAHGVGTLLLAIGRRIILITSYSSSIKLLAISSWKRLMRLKRSGISLDQLLKVFD